QAPDVPLNGLTLMAGGQGNQLIRDVSFPPGTPGQEVTVNNPTDTPNGLTKGRITLALPPLSDNPLHNTLYAGWLYALVSSPQGTFVGLFVTKDFGANWTKVDLPWIPDNPAAQSAFATNDETHNDYDPPDPRPLPNARPHPPGLPRPA